MKVRKILNGAASQCREYEGGLEVIDDRKTHTRTYFRTGQSPITVETLSEMGFGFIREKEDCLAGPQSGSPSLFDGLAVLLGGAGASR